MPDSVTLILATRDDCLKLAAGCGYVVAETTPFGGNRRVWIDLAVKGCRPSAYVCGPEVGTWQGRYTFGYRADDDAPRDPLAVAKELRLTYQTGRRREGVGA
jgi:hypothetical protein